MKIASVLAFVAAAVAAPAAEATKPDTFTVIAGRSASPIHLSSVNAQDTFFWIHKNTTTYCPPEVGTGCPNPKFGPTTAFGFAQGALYMDTEVPGGQRAYIGPKGALRFTIAHSGYSPPGSITDGWTYNRGGPGKYDLGSLARKDKNQALLACPEDGAYKIYVQVPGFVAKDHKGCLSFGAITTKFDGVAAWQYE